MVRLPGLASSGRFAARKDTAPLVPEVAQEEETAATVTARALLGGSRRWRRGRGASREGEAGGGGTLRPLTGERREREPQNKINY
jgi:hypothetical protein